MKGNAPLTPKTIEKIGFLCNSLVAMCMEQDAHISIVSMGQSTRFPVPPRNQPEGL